MIDGCPVFVDVCLPSLVVVQLEFEHLCVVFRLLFVAPRLGLGLLRVVLQLSSVVVQPSHVLLPFAFGLRGIVFHSVVFVLPVDCRLLI